MFAGADRVDSKGRDIYVLDRDPTVFHHVMEYIIIQMKYQQVLVNIIRTKNFGDYYEKKLSILVWTV